ncbi:MAG: patatin-like phospholipase family protein [Trueperaceae bacterium]|nr:patatin-like phospholipase family protein [Trueperaceae bacterium]
MNETPRHDFDIGLVLSGGGARCFAQVGALQAIEEEGLRVCAIAANSSAAIIAALYASGHDARSVALIVRGIDYEKFFDADGATGLIGHDGVEELLKEHAPDTFEELEIPLAVPAVDIERAELIVFREGPLRLAVSASNAFPGLFTPVEYEGRQLLDGGIINNFPVDLIRAMTSRPILAVDVRPPAARPLPLDKEAPASFLGKIGKLFSHGVPVTIDILMQAYTITQSRLVEVTVAMHPPHVWLRPELPLEYGVQDFSRFDEGFEIGYRAVREAVGRGEFEVLRRGGES